MRTPVAIYAGQYDFIASALDAEELTHVFPNVVDFEILPNTDHLSLNFAKNMTYFERVMENMAKY